MTTVLSLHVRMTWRLLSCRDKFPVLLPHHVFHTHGSSLGRSSLMGGVVPLLLYADDLI